MSSAEKTEKKSHRTVSPRSLANLRPYKSGKDWTGNAGGRPKSRLQSEAYRAELAKENEAGETNAELVASQIVAQAKKGKVNAAQHLNRFTCNTIRRQ